MREVMISWYWPAASGHPGKTVHHRAVRKAVSDDGRYWLVKRRGIFRRWQWLPAKGLYLRLREVSAVNDV